MENPFEMDDLVVPPFLETPIYCIYIYKDFAFFLKSNLSNLSGEKIESDQ